MPDDMPSAMSTRRCRGCTPKEAARWLRDTDDGRAWARRREGMKSMAQLVHEAVEASRLAADEANAAAEREAPDKRKREAPMSSISTTLKALRGMDEHTFVKIVTKAAKERFPALSGPQAFTKLFTSDDEAGRAIRAAHGIVKGEADYPRDPDFEDDRDADEESALDALNALAEQERRRDPKLSKAQSFARAYTDPANAALAKRERASAMRRIGAAI
jgi:hypothetical protein